MSNENKIDDGGPAFPQNLPDNFIWRQPGNPRGMTLRDWFAGQALSRFDWAQYTSREYVAKACYEMADAMLKARKE